MQVRKIGTPETYFSFESDIKSNKLHLHVLFYSNIS